MGRALNSASIFWRKVLYELDNALGYVRYSWNKDEVIARLSKTLYNLQIETTNICNADCVFCAYQYQERPTGTMSMELYRKLIDEYVELGGGSLGLTPTVGDPLVDRHLVERIRYARSKPHITSIGMYSNMISLERVGVEALVHSGLSSLMVSTSGLDETMYRRIYRSQMYQQMLANIKKFARINQAAGNPVDLRIDMRVDRPLREVLNYPDYLELATLIGADRIGVKFRYDDWSGRITPDQLSGTMKIRSRLPPRISPCAELFSGPMVYWDGKVGACGCRDVNASELIIGDATRQHLGAIWFGLEIQKLREEFLTDKIRPICATCKHYNNLALSGTLRNRERLMQIEPSPWLRERERSTAESPAVV